MSDDIVTRLQMFSLDDGTDALNKLLAEAADEIERWQDIACRLYLFIQDPCTHNHWCNICSSIDAYEKAVHGD